LPAYPALLPQLGTSAHTINLKIKIKIHFSKWMDNPIKIQQIIEKLELLQILKDIYFVVKTCNSLGGYLYQLKA
jgi:hypothetical protein